MRPHYRSLSIFFALLVPVFGDPIITEFCASNQEGLEDQDGNHSDWVEIHNPDGTPADLTNWYLTDSASNKTKWQFPATTIPAHGYLVVFASDKNRRVPGAELHTSYALSAGGEYLGLIKPDGTTVVSQYSPKFPAQVTDVTYGIPSNLVNSTFIQADAPCQWIIPTSPANPGSSWQDPAFPTTSWNSATMGVGYDRETSFSYLPFIGTNGNIDAAAVAANNATCYVRIPFTVPAGTTLASLKLRARYDDGIAVYLNGVPVLSGGIPLKRNAPATLAWNSTATASRVDSASATYEDFDISENIGSVASGDNVLTIQLMNTTVNSTDQLLQVELSGDVVAPGPSAAPGYFATATPGARNPGPEGLVIPQAVIFSKPSGTYSGTQAITLSGAITGQVIRYTVDGSAPTANSPLYSSAITISDSTLIRARVYESGTNAPGFISSMHYELLGTSLSNYNNTGAPFKSSLPILVLNNNSSGEPANDNIYRDTRIQVYDKGTTGYSSLATSVPTQTLTAGVKLRGRSSASFPKKSYGIEIRSETGDGKDASILGMPAGEDWALIGGYDFDRASMRNAWIYEMSRQAGRWAPRTRLVEVYFNQDGGTLDFSSDYRGVYILCETARTGKDRVDVAKLEIPDIAQPNISGGYIFKVDPPEADEFSWRTSRGLPLNNDGCMLVIHRPKLTSLATQQSTYLRNYFQAFENSAFTESNSGFTTRNYRNYINSASWADHNLFCALAKNVDALRLSAYYYKDRNEKISAGPLWDFDRSVDSTDGRDDSPTGWNGTGDGTNYHAFAWWQPLFQDVEFRQVYVDRWQALRRTTLSTANVNAVLQGYLDEYKVTDSDNPSTRDHALWYGSPASSNVTAETNAMKTWLSSRSSWIDGRFVSPPVIVRPPGPVTAGQTTTVNVASGTTVYYTTDGTDPRMEGGSLRPGAITYNAGTPITISSTTRLVARAFRAGAVSIPATNWSGPVEALYLVDEPYATAATLRVSAVNYNPLAPNAAEKTAISTVTAADFEWIELQNVSATAVNLEGVSMVNGSPVSPVTLPAFSLAPGTRAVIAKNAAAFQLRYGAAAAARVMATWAGYRSLDDGSSQITLMDKFGTIIANFEYSDSGDWPTRADGSGSSLEYIGSSSAQADYENPLLWKSSTAVHGAPGIGDSVRSGVVLNEILASRTAANDGIELYNSGENAVDLSGWYISNNMVATTEADYRQFKIPNGTILAAGDYLVFDGTNFNPTPGSPADTDFALDGARGGTLWLISADAASGRLLNFEQKEDYTPTIAGVAYGRSPNGIGALVPLGRITLGETNSAPRIGSVQVSEIQYHPAGSAPEFVEISNTGSVSEPLASWTLRGDVDFDFPAGFMLAPAEAIVMVSFDPVTSPAAATAFRSQYGVPVGVRLIGPWAEGNTLSNTAGTTRLRRRVPAPEGDSGFVGLMIEDEVNYLSSVPWPTGASGTDSSIRRLGIFRQPNDPTAWVAASPSPGSGVGGFLAWQMANFAIPENGAATADADFDGLPNLVEYMLGSDPSVPTSLTASVDANNGSSRIVLDYSLRLDRDDASLDAEQSLNLETWSPAANDEILSSDGIIQQRRAWLPLDDNGFLRLKATTGAAAN